jgi:hypothetical protein
MPQFSLKKFFGVVLFVTLLGCLKSFGANSEKIEILDENGSPIAQSTVDASADSAETATTDPEVKSVFESVIQSVKPETPRRPASSSPH